MASSLYKIAEKAKLILGKGDLQSIISSVQDVYASQVKLSWFENKQEGVTEINGVFIYTFKDLVPVLDCDIDLYGIDVPSSYLNLPNQSGINQVSFAKGQNKPFVMVSAASWGMFANLKSWVMGGNHTFFVEGTKMYFPIMTKEIVDSMVDNNTGLLLKMSVALDTVDPDADLNIPPNVVDNIVNIVVAKYAPKPEVKPETLN